MAWILIIEDHVDSAWLLQKVLEHVGHETSVAYTATEAIEMVQEIQYDMIVSDYSLPDGKGVDLLPKIRGFTAAPAIIFSGSATPATIQRCIDAGFVAHCAKPMNLKCVVDTIDSILKEKTGSHPRG